MARDRTHASLLFSSASRGGGGGGGAWVINLRELKNTLYLSFVVFVVPHLLCFVVENFKNAFNVL